MIFGSGSLCDYENFADLRFQLYSGGCMQRLQWDNEVKSIQPRPGAETELQAKL